MILRTIILVSSLLLLTGCAGSHVPNDVMQLHPQSLQKRQLQSKKFYTLNEAKMLVASIEVLQDMGFMINETESKLGVIIAEKNRETDNRGQRMAIITIRILAGDQNPLAGVESAHTIRAALVTTPDKSKKNTTVRINFQRQVFDLQGDLVRSESVHESNLYTGFFSKLSKSVFLEAHEV